MAPHGGRNDADLGLGLLMHFDLIQDLLALKQVLLAPPVTAGSTKRARRNIRPEKDEMCCDPFFSMLARQYRIIHLVGGIPTPLENVSSSFGMSIPNI